MFEFRTKGHSSIIIGGWKNAGFYCFPPKPIYKISRLWNRPFIGCYKKQEEEDKQTNELTNEKRNRPKPLCPIQLFQSFGHKNKTSLIKNCGKRNKTQTFCFIFVFTLCIIGCCIDFVNSFIHTYIIPDLNFETTFSTVKFLY